jgi:regulator of nonsense transcripts 2
MISPLLELLRKEFYGLLKAKKQSPYIDSKIKNIRLQCELIKFRICPPIVIFKVFKALLSEFNPHSIEMLVVGLETTGRFLYLLHYTHEYMEKILDTMMRLRRAKNLDLHQQTLLESAYFVVKPPERTNLKSKMIKKRTVLEEYIRYLILEKLDDPYTSIDTTIKSLRRLPWNQPVSETEPYKVDYYILKTTLKLAKTKYITIPSLADCLSGLMKFYPNLIISIVDRCLEEIQRALEIPYKREIQKILGLTKLLGELYNFTAIPSSLIFDFLYHCINYGHFNQNLYQEDFQATTTTTLTGSSSIGSVLPMIHPGQFVFAGYPISSNNNLPLRYYDPRILTEMDLPTDLFRSQIICEILNTTGLYYVRGNMKEKLSRYLTYFQRYLLTKQLIPLHIEFCILDTFDNLEELAKEAYLEENPIPIVTSTMSKKGKGGKGVYVPPPLTSSSASHIPTSFFSRYDNYETVQNIIDGFEQQQKNNAAAGIKEEDEEMMENTRPTMKNEGKRGEDDEKEGEEEEDDDEDDDEEDEESDDDDEESSSEDEEDDDEVPLDDEDDEDEEAAATKMLEKLRIVEEDEEFEKAFKAVVQVRKLLFCKFLL